jgi:hypothetical protein
MTICNVQIVFFVAVMSTTFDVRGGGGSGCRLSVQYDCCAWSGDKDPAYDCPVIAPNSCSYCSYAKDHIIIQQFTSLLNHLSVSCLC